MGIIYNPYTKEKELYNAYNMTVYGKINRFEWSIYTDRPTENCYITLRIADSNGNDLLNINLGNNAILERTFKETIDNFLYWIKSEEPTTRKLESQVFESLCKSDSIFNHRMEMRKFKERKEAEERKRMEEMRKMENEALAAIDAYCKDNGFFFHNEYGEITILKALTNESRHLISQYSKNEKIKDIIDYIEKYPSQNDARIVVHGTMEEVLKRIS